MAFKMRQKTRVKAFFFRNASFIESQKHCRFFTCSPAAFATAAAAVMQPLHFRIVRSIERAF